MMSETEHWIRSGRGRVIALLHGIGAESALDYWDKFRQVLQTDEKLRDFGLFVWKYPTHVGSGRLRDIVSSVRKRTLRGTAPNIKDLGAVWGTTYHTQFRDYQEVILVCHSMGGLVVKSWIIDTLEQGQSTTLETLRHISFYATPHNGAPITTLANWNEQLKDMQLNSLFIEDIGNRWHKHVVAWKEKVPGAEASLYNRYIPHLVIAGLVDHVVPPKYATIRGMPLTRVQGDHSEVIQPTHADDTRYKVWQGDMQKALQTGSLSIELYNRLYKALLNCEEFESNVRLQAIIANGELAIYSRWFRGHEHECETKEKRIEYTIKYLTRQRLRKTEPALLIFLMTIYNNLIEGDALRDELEELHRQVKLELARPLYSYNLSSLPTAPENVPHNNTGNHRNTFYPEKTSNYTVTQQESHSIEKKLQEVRGQYRTVQTSPTYKIDVGSSIIEYNLDQQKNKFIEGLDGQYKGVFVFTVANSDREVLKDYVLGSLIWKLKQHIKRPTDPVRHVYLSLEYLDFSSIEQGVHSLQQEFERQLSVHSLIDLLLDNQRTNLVIVLWHRDITRDHFKHIALEFIRRLKAQVTDILRGQERCLILFWANYGPSIQPLDVPTVLPTFEQFAIQHLSEWLEYEIGTQLRDQNVSEQEIKCCREKIVAKLQHHRGRLPETYEILCHSLELGGVF